MLLWLPAKNDGKEDNKNITILPPKMIRANADQPPEKISISAITEVCREILCLYHDHISARHPGRDETL
jgi:hypothetical protein